MSWKDAQREAEKWIESLKLGKTSGQVVDLSAHGATLPSTSQAYREMVMEAARRILRKRGAASVIMPV